jgi:hypothetical protein
MLQLGLEVIRVSAHLRGTVGRKEVITLANGRVIRRVTVFDGTDSWDLAVADGLMDKLVEGKTYDLSIRPRMVAGKLLLEIESISPVSYEQQ